MLYDVIFVWCDQWSTIREDKESDDDEEHKEENDLILSFGDLPRAFQYAERCFHICIEMKKRLSGIDVDLRQCYERVALISMYRETQLSSILSLNSSFSQSTSNKASATTIDNFKTALNLAISTKKSGDVDMTTVHLRILLSDLLVDEENMLQSLRERMKLLEEAVETSKGNQEYTLDALSALHTLRARTVLEHVKVKSNETEKLLSIVERERTDGSEVSFATRKFDVLCECIRTFEQIRIKDPYHHRTTYELARTLHEGKSLYEAHRREVSTIWMCNVRNGVAFRSRHGDFSSKILAPPGPSMNDRVIALERRGEWIRVQSIVGRDATNSEGEKWLPLFHEKQGYLFVPADDVYVIFTHLYYSLVLLTCITRSFHFHNFTTQVQLNGKR